MSIDIETSVALRGIANLQRLVVSVVGAEDHDEPDWLEWKSTLDLATKEGCFPVAKAILGMANRLPAQAAVACEGLSYVVVGAEPKNCPGVATVDPATLTQLIEPYLGGANGPAWTPTYVPTDQGVTVLVVTIEAPRQGDPIFTLRREFSKARSGTVFVRRPGRTVPADANDLDVLQERLTAAAPPTALEVSVTGDVPMSWLNRSKLRESLETWVAARIDAMTAAARATEARRLAPKQTDDSGVFGSAAAVFAAQESSMVRMGILGPADKRTLDDYICEVEAWGEATREGLPSAVLGRYLDAGHGIVAVEVTNPTGRFLTDVEVEVAFEGGHIGASEDLPEEDELPPEPHPYGKRKTPSPLGSSLGFGVAPYLQMRPPSGFSPSPSRTRVELVNDSVRIRFHIGNLRQHATETSAGAFLLVNDWIDGVLHGTWTATVRDPECVIEGDLEIPLNAQPIDPQTLLAT